MSHHEARGKLLRKAPEGILESTNMGRFCQWLGHEKQLTLTTYSALWEWSVNHLEDFWQAIIEFYRLDLGPYQAILPQPQLPPKAWLPGARVSYPQHILQYRGAQTALVGVSQTRERIELSRDQLHDQVARCAEGLRQRGIQPGDVVAAYLPNMPEATIAFLATASIGAIWVSCAPEFGVKAVVDRLSQVQPRLLLAIGGYRYGDKSIDRREQVAQICQSVTSIEHLIDVPYHPAITLDRATPWPSLLNHWRELDCYRGNFDHPLYILFSSGTSGLPKAIVHGHGGILLEHVKALGLHNDVSEDDVFFWFSTTGWMVWNYSVSALLLGSRMVCFDGNPMAPDVDNLWALAEKEKLTYFGNSATFYMSCLNAGSTPARDYDLGTIQAIGSTGSPLPTAGFEWLADQFGAQVVIASVAGGTDICSAFLGASPMVDIRAGELAAPMLGCRVEALDAHGQPIVDEPGELVVTTPMPSMPVKFWNDPRNQRFHEAYFNQNPGMWTHGDWIIIYPDYASVITGRSDSTLNRGGVRLGTADFYDLIEAIPEVRDSLIIHLEDDDGGLGQLILFLVAQPGANPQELERTVTLRLRNELSPRHVPDNVVWLNAIPRTLTGKKIETPVKRILQGASIEQVANPDSLGNAQAIDEIVAWYTQHSRPSTIHNNN
ncbi:acetoacetate--CoA ligase [Halioxenophilus aromaticivorans]|uniref:Acetoacetate--CoA ligase n=1 Tax=Halioxenophilus aromaticivorans TaxID=1306992 RepID=A0AAV3TXE9_9ALTE